MQNTLSETEEKNILKLYRVTIFLEPITESLWYEMKREQQNLPTLSEANKLNCAFCLEEFEPTSTFAKCLDCEQSQVLICIECLRLGMESHPHKRNHRYTLCDTIGPVLFDEGQNSWGAQEDLQLLNSLMRAHLNQWPELSKDWGKRRTLREAMDRLDRSFIRGQIGQYVLKKYKRGFVKEWNEEENGESNQLHPVPSTSSQLPTMANDFANRNGGKYGGTPSKTPSSEGMEEMMVNGEIVNGIGPDHQQNAPSTSPIQKRRAYFDEEESSDPDLKEIGERRMSTRSVGAESSSNPVENRKVRKEQQLAAAKNEAAEALRGKMRKTSLELSEAINFEVNVNGTSNNKKKQSKHQRDKTASADFLSPQQLVEFYSNAAFNPYFFNFPPPPMDSHTAAKFDEEDLQLLTYSPFRTEFENEYKNDAEQLISRILFPREDAEYSEVEEFLNEVRYARFNRYNRLMRIRAAKKNAILEHNLLGEYLGIVKTNISEKGKYAVFADRYFSIKSKEDFFRPIFCQLRQVADKETINQLAKDIGAMETLKDQIDELKALQRKGVTKLKGRLKMDSAPVFWSKKRKGKNKKAKENAEQRKAGLRWKRIKRWTKRNHLQNVEGGQEGEEDEEEE